MQQTADNKILIVDDSRATQAILRRIVLATVSVSASNVRTVDSATEALDLLDTFDPDLIITDWHMPDVTGLEMLQTLRQLGHNRVRVGLVTAETQARRLAEAHLNGVSFVLHKPFKDDALTQAVQAALVDPAPHAKAVDQALPATVERPAPHDNASLTAWHAAVQPSSPISRKIRPGPISLEALVRLCAVAIKKADHQVEDSEAMHFPQLSPTVLRCTFEQAASGQRVVALVDLIALCLLGAGAQGLPQIQQAINLARPDPDVVQRAVTVLRVSAKLLLGHTAEEPFKLVRNQIVARALADPDDLLTKAMARTDVVVRAGFLGMGRISYLRAQ